MTAEREFLRWDAVVASLPISILPTTAVSEVLDDAVTVLDEGSFTICGEADDSGVVAAEGNLVVVVSEPFFFEAKAALLR